jgi:hypothetical protein
MQRRAATTLHLALSVVGAVLYVLFVLPRWWVLTGDFPDTLATVGRVAAGVPIALAAIPVMLNLRQSIKPELGTPELALRLRAWSAVMHVVAGVVIILTAIAEIWITIDSGGPWLFAVYGAAAAIAVLGIAAFYLSRVAEKPPGEPEPAKAAKPPRAPTEKKEKRRKRGGKVDEGDTDKATTNASETADEAVPTSEAAVEDSDAIDIVGTESDIARTDAVEAALDQTKATAPAESEGPVAGSLRNKRPTGKKRHRIPR